MGCVRVIVPLSEIRLILRLAVAAGLSPASVSQVHRVLRAAFHHAVNERTITHSPLDGVKEPRAQARDIQPLEDGEIRLLLSGTAGDPLHLLWAILATTGLRLGEGLGLRWDSIDFDRGFLEVRQALKRIAGKGLVLETPKTAKSKRAVSLPPTLIALLKRERAKQRAVSLERGEPWDEARLLFTTQRGTPLDPSRVDAIFLRSLERCGLRRIRIHDLRHTVASRLARNGFHPVVVQNVLGHSSVGMTLGTYTHLPTLQDPVARAMETLFQEPQEVLESGS